MISQQITASIEIIPSAFDGTSSDENCIVIGNDSMWLDFNFD